MLIWFWHPCMVMFSNELDNPVSTQGVCSWWTASAAEPSYNGSVCMCEFWLLFTGGMSYYWVNDTGVRMLPWVGLSVWRPEAPKTLVAFMAKYCNDFPCNWRLPSQEVAYSTSQTHRPKSRVPQPPLFLENPKHHLQRGSCGNKRRFAAIFGNFGHPRSIFGNFGCFQRFLARTLLPFASLAALGDFLEIFCHFQRFLARTLPVPFRTLPVPFSYPSRTLLVPFSYPSRTLLVPFLYSSCALVEGYEKGTRRARTKNRPKTGKIAQNRSSTTRIAKKRCKLFFLPQFTPKRRPNCPNTVFRPLRVRCAPLAATFSLSVSLAPTLFCPPNT